MDFFDVVQKTTKKENILFPNFKVVMPKDFMVRGKAFYAIWDEEAGLWSTNEYDVARLVDKEIWNEYRRITGGAVSDIKVRTMASYSSGSWASYKAYLKNMYDNAVQLDTKLTFMNTDVKREDYVSKRLPYSLEPGDIYAYEDIISTLYDPEERAKLEWAIGSIVAGDSKDIQKFIVLYGEAGAGKSTILNIIQELFPGYYTTFEAKALASSSNVFSTEAFRTNPLVAIQHDGDLSRIEDNTKLNSIISHEEMVMHEKYKSSYTSKLNCFLFMATNRPVKITDAKSGIIRRLIDVRPSGRKLSPNKYFAAMQQIPFELGAIAHHCMQVYLKMGKNYYTGYRPMEMIEQTDVFYNFVEANYQTFKDQDGCTLTQAYDMYKTYCEESFMEFKLPRYRFREELKNYFEDFYKITRVNGKQVRSYYSGFIKSRFISSVKLEESEPPPPSLTIDKEDKIFDEVCADMPAQYATSNETPGKKWANVTTKLSDLDSTRLHYVKIPQNHIVIDFDLKDESGEKSYVKNLEAASKWPPTYAELSKSGKGIHLHYIYEGDVNQLSRVYADSIEVKVFTGDSSLRRKFTKSNGLQIATIKSGLPLKEVKPVINFNTVISEKTIREQIERNLRKEIHGATAPSVSMISKILEDAYNSGSHYDVTDMRPRVLAFAANSTHQAQTCIRMVNEMKFKSDDISDPGEYKEDSPIVFYDVEVFPNLFVIVWKYDGPEHKCVRMINPTPQEVGELFKFRLVGFNCRRYDNHILYARHIGYSNEQLYDLSQKIVNGSKNCFFGEAYNISYTDVYDFASAGNKKSLKKFEIELGIHHLELGLPWDEPVSEELWTKVAEYCDNDVIATEATFHYLKADWTARQILADLAGMTVNDTTNSLTTRIIFGKERNPQREFNYRNLAEPVKNLNEDTTEFLKKACPEMMAQRHGEEESLLPYFPGYTFDHGKSIYRGEVVGEGGYVYAEPGMWYDVALLDVSSMHPHSAIAEVIFGTKYTEVFRDIVEGRVDIKHEEWDEVNKILDGKITPFIERVKNGEMSSKDLANGLKTAINSVYGLTSASFDNAFKDPRNKDNIVAKRGALFMLDLKAAVQEKGFTVAHIKTDSIKIPNATPEIINFVMDFGKKYGYTFEHEATYSKMCLVNDAVYIAKYQEAEKCEKMYSYIPGDCNKHGGEWTATGAQFAQPYVFKTLFSHEPIEFKDLCETKNVSQGNLYLDMNEKLPEDEHAYVFIGRTSSFVPIAPGKGGGVLYRGKDDKYYAATGTKGYRWLEAGTVKDAGMEDCVDLNYHRTLVDEALANISKYGDAERFISSDDVELPFVLYPWCGTKNCNECEHYKVDCEGLPF